MAAPRRFIEVDHHQLKKQGQAACGDVFLSQKVDEDSRVITVLADGLGSGIKATVLANLTATMVARFVAGDVNITQAARIIMETLPVCKVRRIAYSTFTIVDMDRSGETRIIEYDNPPFVLLREGHAVEVPREPIPLSTADGRAATLFRSHFDVRPGDRIALFSDGVTQAGVGRGVAPLGWGLEAATAFLEQTVRDRPSISARELARTLVRQASAMDGYTAKDDITCGAIYIRKPREVLVFTGAPVDKARDKDLAELARNFDGRKIACGGTTACILARELGLRVDMNLADLNPDVPPASRMDGFDLVTEGAITLAFLVRLLEQESNPEALRPNAATRLASILLDSDIITFAVGTRINDALQDPSLPEELDIRRNIIRRLAHVLEEKFLKEVRIKFM